MNPSKFKRYKKEKISMLKDFNIRVTDEMKEEIHACDDVFTVDQLCHKILLKHWQGTQVGA